MSDVGVTVALLVMFLSLSHTLSEGLNRVADLQQFALCCLRGSPKAGVNGYS